MVGAAVAVAVAVAFSVLLGSLGSLEEANRARARADLTVAAASTAEQSVLDMETGLRGFLIARERRFLGPWYQGRAAFGPAVTRLSLLTEHDGYPARQLASGIAQVGSRFIADYGEPLARPGAPQMGAAELPRIASVGKRWVDALRGMFARLDAISSAQAKVKVDAANAVGSAARTRAVLGLGVALGLIACAVLYLVSRVSRPVRRIADAADALAGGELIVRAPERGPGEVMRLGRSFNRMAQTIADGSRTLRARNRELAESHARVERAARELATQQDLAVDIVATASFDGYFTSINQAATRILGFTEAELTSRPFNDFVHPEDRDRTAAEAAKLAASGVDTVSFENRYQTKRGSYRWLEWNVHPVLADGRLYAVARDVTARHEAEQALRQAREEAERANEATRELLVRQNDTLEAQVRERTSELERSRLEAFEKLALAAEFRDDDTRLHTRRVGKIAAALAAAVGLEPSLVSAIGLVAPLHDLGKIGVPDAILLKPGKLSAEEFTAMQAHARIGAEILGGSSSPLFQLAGDIAGAHHERWDGTGYPRGLAGEAIPLGGRIVALADAFDAMSHDRPYRAAIPLPDVIAEIKRCSGTHFDPALVSAFGGLDHSRLLTSLADAEAVLTPLASAELQRLDQTGTSASISAVDAALDAVLENMPAAALIADDDRRYVAANPAACELLGLTVAELRQTRIDDLLPPHIRPHVDQQWADFLNGGVKRGERTLLLSGNRRVRVASRGVARLLPGRHLALLEPLRPSEGNIRDDTHRADATESSAA